MSKYTPGPWKYDEDSLGVNLPGFQKIRFVNKPRISREKEAETRAANARLVAEAPMLLHWLKLEHGHCIRACCDVCITIEKAEGART